MAIFNPAPTAVEQAPARQILSYHFDGFHHLKMVDAEKATNEIVDYYNNINEFVNALTPGICDHLTYIGVIPTSLEVGITADTEEDWNTAYVEAVFQWIAENIDLFSANLELAMYPKAGYIARKYVYTTDDWHPTCENSSVMVRFMQLLPDPKAGFRIAVWGNDDFGLEKDVASFNEAEALYREITALENLTIQELLDKDFVNV